MIFRVFFQFLSKEALRNLLLLLKEVLKYFSLHQGGNIEKCSQCTRTVYAMEKLEVAGRVMHKTCFRCCKCNSQLRWDKKLLFLETVVAKKNLFFILHGSISSMNKHAKYIFGYSLIRNKIFSEKQVMFNIYFFPVLADSPSAATICIAWPTTSRPSGRRGPTMCSLLTIPAKGNGRQKPSNDVEVLMYSWGPHSQHPQVEQCNSSDSECLWRLRTSNGASFPANLKAVF